MRVQQAHLASSKRRKKQLKDLGSSVVGEELLGATFDIKAMRNGDDAPQLENIKIKNLNNMHKTAVDKHAGDGDGQFPKLPGLVIKGQGNERQPISSRGEKAFRNSTTSAYALSPKLVKQLKLEEKMNHKQKEEEEDVKSTAGMNITEILEHRRNKELQEKRNKENEAEIKVR